MPQFTRQSVRPLTPRSIAASVRRGRQLLDTIERYADPQDSREKAQLTRAIHGLANWARSLSRRHRGTSVAEEAAIYGGAGGLAGTGESKVRGDADYYRRAARARWDKTPPT